MSVPSAISAIAKWIKDRLMPAVVPARGREATPPDRPDLRRPDRGDPKDPDTLDWP